MDNSVLITSTSETVKLSLFFFNSLFVSFGVFKSLQYFFYSERNQASNRKYILGLIKRRSKAH